MVSGSLSVISEGSEHDKARSPLSTYTEKFYEEFPYYLSIGMTYEQFWNGDPALAKYYRQADELKNDKRNQELWLQGMYIYNAFCCAAPILNAFAKKGTKPIPYPEKPYALTHKQREREKEEKERLLAEKGKRFMGAMIAKFNSRFTEKSQSE